MGQMSLCGYEFPDLTSQIAPLTIEMFNVPLWVTKDVMAEMFFIAQDCITLKRKRGKPRYAIIVPPSWDESDSILSHHFKLFGKQKALLRQSYDSNTSRPSSKHYKPHMLSSEEFDLSPACSGQPTLHVLNDDVLLHIMKYINVAEKLMLEAVCRRFQSLVYRELGQNNVIDFTDDGCVWRSAHSNLPKCRSKSPAELTQDLKLCTYKMLIMNANLITTLKLDEYHCIFDVNVFAAIGQLAVNLEDLCLQFSSKRKHYTPMKTIFSRCTKLRTLSLEVLHFIAAAREIKVLLKSALPDVEDLYIELPSWEVYNMHSENEVLTVDFSLAPTSVLSLTLPSVALDDNSYESLLRMPKLQRVFVKSKKFSMVQLKLLVAHVQLVEIGAAMVSVDLSTAQELTALRRKALAEGRAKFPSQCLDHDEPLVLHVNYAHHVAFDPSDPFIKIKDHKLNSYIYELVGSCRFDKWLDFGNDVYQQ
ncbi:uncharacterized protein LOC108672891 isoform X5 [Hyalella azteca]|uniref:Uncharacterized protein LOC108672891 isoform X5 n=1 Tax=Hyalella azteca TaxID=294128 RepID=A0A979FI05_HYAAZ|nr:uncharacterized protein LOC108672891 isoform X5 [Hyalella azteca]